MPGKWLVLSMEILRNCWNTYIYTSTWVQIGTSNQISMGFPGFPDVLQKFPEIFLMKVEAQKRFLQIHIFYEWLRSQEITFNLNKNIPNV